MYEGSSAAPLTGEGAVLYLTIRRSAFLSLQAKVLSLGTHTTDPVNIGGLGLHQTYWTYRSRYFSLLTIYLPAAARSRSPHSPLRELVSNPLSQSMAPIRDYVALLKQLGACAPIALQQWVVPQGGPELYDEEYPPGGILMMGVFYSPERPMLLSVITQLGTWPTHQYHMYRKRVRFQQDSLPLPLQEPTATLMGNRKKGQLLSVTVANSR
jgi:hypothetical protein|mmetsp:Transcript_83416/g.139193  ORF Transcript_83416/g.139193 Transcript_83416/m.139193 type:complete len:211 (-) Transcript_83416:206-838(-)